MNLSPGIHPGLDFEDYLALPYANASSLKLARKSIAHMLAPRRESSAFSLGTAVHSAVLEGWETFKERTAVWPKTFKTKSGKTSTSRNTTEAKEWRDRMLSDGMEILEYDQVLLVKRVLKNISEHEAAAGLLERAKPRHECRELTCVWVDPEWDIPCKCRFDAISDGSIIVDLKTTRSAYNPDFGRDAARYAYHMQAAHYVQGFAHAYGERPDAYVIIAVETEEPYGVAVYHITEDWLWAGSQMRDEAMAVRAEWYCAGRPQDVPPYPTDKIVALKMPGWA